MSWSSDEATSPLAESSPSIEQATSPLSPNAVAGPSSSGVQATGPLNETSSQVREKLYQRFEQCCAKRSDHQKPPDLNELKSSYGDASKEDLFYTIRPCAKRICYGARSSILQGQDVETAKALQKKWTRMDGPQVTQHMKDLVELRSIEDLRSMLADAFKDVANRITQSTDDGDGFEVVKKEASVPEPGKKWY